MDQLYQAFRPDKLAPLALRDKLKQGNGRWFLCHRFQTGDWYFPFFSFFLTPLPILLPKCSHGLSFVFSVHHLFVFCVLSTPFRPHHFFSSAPITIHISPSSDTWLCSPASSLALLHQQGQPASQQRSTGCPSQQRPSARDAYPRLPGRPWLPNDDDPRATIALPEFTTGTCLLHTRTGRRHRNVHVQVVMPPDFLHAYYSYFCF